MLRPHHEYSDEVRISNVYQPKKAPHLLGKMRGKRSTHGEEDWLLQRQTGLNLKCPLKASPVNPTFTNSLETHLKLGAGSREINNYQIWTFEAETSVQLLPRLGGAKRLKGKRHANGRGVKLEGIS